MKAPVAFWPALTKFIVSQLIWAHSSSSQIPATSLLGFLPYPDTRYLHIPKRLMRQAELLRGSKHLVPLRTFHISRISTFLLDVCLASPLICTALLIFSKRIQFLHCLSCTFVNQTLIVFFSSIPRSFLENQPFSAPMSLRSAHLKLHRDLCNLHFLKCDFGLMQNVWHCCGVQYAYFLRFSAVASARPGRWAPPHLPISKSRSLKSIHHQFFNFHKHSQVVSVRL